MSYCDKINCGYYYKTEEEDFPRCHYDYPWPAPCDMMIEVCCGNCYHVDQDTEEKVACCNCCENYDFFEMRFEKRREDNAEV